MTPIEDDNNSPTAASSCLKQQQHRKWILFSLAFGCVSLVGGLVYGWPALRRDLLQQRDGDTTSHQQWTEKQLGGIFTVGAWSTQGGRFFTGIARDRYGTRIVACTVMFCTALGCLGIAFLADNSSVVGLGISMFLIGIGSGAQLCMQPVAGLFPNHAGSVLASLSGAFQVSGLIFLALTSMKKINRRSSFLGFSFLVVGLCALAAIILPTGKLFLLVEGEDDDDLDKKEHNNAACSSSDTVHDASESRRDTSEKDLSDISPVSILQEDESGSTIVPTGDNTEHTAPSPKNAIQQIRSWEYLGLSIWFCVLLIPLQYYVGSIGFQLERRGDDDGLYTDLFSVVYASAAVLAPGAGYLADKFGLGIAQGLATLLSAMSLFILSSTRISLDAHVFGLISYGVGRMLVFSFFFTNVGKRFGYDNYGTLAGLNLLTSAIASLLQYPLIAAASDGHDTIVDVACGVAIVALLPYCFWLGWIERQQAERTE